MAFEQWRRSPNGGYQCDTSRRCHVGFDDYLHGDGTSDTTWCGRRFTTGRTPALCQWMRRCIGSEYHQRPEGIFG